jgi:hypothetical protein
MKNFAAKYEPDAVSYTAALTTSFPRFLAKIAYGMVVFQYGLDAIDRLYVIPCLLGKKDDVGRWVGCEDDNTPPNRLPREQCLHRIHLHRNEYDEVAARIRLFARFQSPEYLVIVGRVKEIAADGGKE